MQKRLLHTSRLWLCVALVLAIPSFRVLAEEKTGLDAVRLMEAGKAGEAIEILEGLAAKGDDRAMVQLGIYYHGGTGVQQDYTKAMDWWLKAWHKDNVGALVNLAVMHRDGNGVPKNRKIAYCVFLAVHMCGLGTEATQMRNNHCLRKIMAEISLDEVKDCLSNYTVPYVLAYLDAKGKMEGIPEKYRPGDKRPALRDTGWWLDSELDAIFGPPTGAEEKARKERDERARAEMDALRHSLVFEVRLAEKHADRLRACGLVTEGGMQSRPVRHEELRHADGRVVLHERVLIYAEKRRYVTVEDSEGNTFAFVIDHPVKPVPRDWGEWLKPTYVAGADENVLAVLGAPEPPPVTRTMPEHAPELRFKVVKD